MGFMTTRTKRLHHQFVFLLCLLAAMTVGGQSTVGNDTSKGSETVVNGTTVVPSTSDTNSTTPSNATTANFGGVFNIISPETVWQQKTRFRLGSVVPIQWSYDKLVTHVPEVVGIVVAPLNTPDRTIVLTTTQPGNQNYSWNTADFKEELTEGWYILKIWDIRNGDPKKGPTTAPTEAGYVRPFVGNYNPFALYSGSTYVDDPMYCPTCINGAPGKFSLMAWTAAGVVTAVIAALL